MTYQVPADDEQLLAELAAALRGAEPRPERARDVARGAYAWRTIDQELALAELVFDSSVGHQQLVRRDAAPGARTLVFEADSLALDLEIAADVIIGQVRPPQLVRITMVSTDRAAFETTTDPDGSFSIAGPITTSIRLDCRTASDAVSTGWFTPHL